MPDETGPPTLDSDLLERRTEGRADVGGSVVFDWVDEESRVHAAEATLLDEAEHGLALLTDFRLESGATIRIRDYRGRPMSAVVRYSRYAGDVHWRTGLKLLPVEARRAEREKVSGEARLTWTDARGRDHAVNVRVCDLSEHGLGLVSAEPLPVGQVVTMSGDLFECFCSIRYCRPVEAGEFRVGVRFAREPKERPHGGDREWMD